MREYTLDEIMAHPAFAEAFCNELYGPGLEKEAIYGLITKGLSKLPFGSTGRMAREVAADAAKKIEDPLEAAAKKLKNKAAAPPPNANPPTPDAAKVDAPPPGSQASGQTVPKPPGYDPEKLKRKAPKPESVLPGGLVPSARRKGSALAGKGDAAGATTPKPETVNVMGMDVKKDNLPYLAGAGLLGAGALGAGAGYVLGS